MTLLRDHLADLPSCDAARATRSRRAADILRPSGALAWLDEIAAWVAGWQRLRTRRVARPARPDLRRRPRRRRGTQRERVPDRRHRRRCSTRTRRAVDDQRVRRDRRRDRDGDRRRRRASDRRHPHRGGDGPSAFDEVVQTRSTPSTRSTATSSSSARWGSATRPRRRRSPPRSPAVRPRRGSAAAPASTTRDSPASATPCRVGQRRIAGITDPIEILREVGGAELVGHRRRHRRRPPPSIPVVLDGYVVTASVLPLIFADPARSTTARSATARPSPAIASSSNASTSGRCSTSTCASAKGPGRWPPSR